MNCLFEGVCGLYLFLRERCSPPLDTHALEDACAHMETCKATLSSKERELTATHDRLGRMALDRRKLSDTTGVRRYMAERRRVLAKVERVRACLGVVDKQLDALQNRELNQELFKSLSLSNHAMKRVGVTADTDEAERLMGELDDQIAHSVEFTQVLSTPLESDVPGADAGELDLDAELQLLETEYTPVGDTAVPTTTAPTPTPTPAPTTSAPIITSTQKTTPQRKATPVPAAPQTREAPDEIQDETMSLLPAPGLTRKGKDGRRLASNRFEAIIEGTSGLVAA